MVGTIPGNPPIEHADVEKHAVFLQGVVVEFDGFRALDITRFGVEYNELRVVIGPNGAGKTTLCDVISGKTRVKGGRVFFNKIETTTVPDSENRSHGRRSKVPDADRFRQPDRL